MDQLRFNSGNSGILESTREYSGITRGSYGNDSGMTREYLGDSGRVRDMTEEKKRNLVVLCKRCLWTLTYQSNPFAKVVLANLSSLQRSLAMRTRNLKRNTGWYDPKIARGMDRKWWDRGSGWRVLFYGFCCTCWSLLGFKRCGPKNHGQVKSRFSTN